MRERVRERDEGERVREMRDRVRESERDVGERVRE